jgi:hypothetical protein
MVRLLTPARYALGLLLTALAVNHMLAFVLPFPVGNTPMGLEFLEALHFSRLINVAMGLMLVAGLMLLTNCFVPLGLAMVIPVLVCMAWWAAVLENSVPWGVVALLAIALAALLMFAHLPSYTGMLQTRPLAVGENASARYERFYAWPAGQTAPATFALALVPMVLAAAFYYFIVPSMLAFYCIVMLAWPLSVLVLRTVQWELVRTERGE